MAAPPSCLQKRPWGWLPHRSLLFFGLPGATLSLVTIVVPAQAGTLFMGLGKLHSSGGSEATGVSADGSVVVGVSRAAAPPGASEAFRWTLNQGMKGIGFLPGGGNQSEANGISGNGEVIVKNALDATQTHYQAFRWTSDDGMVPLGGLDPANVRSNAHAANHDGTLIVGGSPSPLTGSSSNEA